MCSSDLQTPKKYKGSRDYYKQQYANKMDNLEEMDKFVEKYNLVKLNKEEIENMDKLSVIKLKQ